MKLGTACQILIESVVGNKEAHGNLREQERKIGLGAYETLSELTREEWAGPLGISFRIGAIGRVPSGMSRVGAVGNCS